MELQNSIITQVFYIVKDGKLRVDIEKTGAFFNKQLNNLIKELNEED